MFANTGLDLRFLADIHNIAVQLTKAVEIQQLALAKIANDIGTITSTIAVMQPNKEGDCE